MRVRYERNGDVGELVLADPPLNLFSRELIADLFAALDAARADAPRALLIHAEGDAFSAGADVSIFADHDLDSARAMLHPFLHRTQEFASWPVPKVAAVNGLCLAAGFEVALGAEIIWAADDAQMGLVEALIGVTPFGGGAARLAARCGLGRAAEAVYGARIYPAQKMLDWGVVQRIVPADQLLEKTRQLAAMLAAGPTRAHAATSATLNAWAAGGIEAADRVLAGEGPRVLVTEDVGIGIQSLLEKGPGQARFTGR